MDSDLHVVADLYLVVEFDAIADHRVAQGAAIDGGSGANFDIIAECRMEIEMARLLCLKAAWMIDQGDARAAAPWISQIKVIGMKIFQPKRMIWS